MSSRLFGRPLPSGRKARVDDDMRLYAIGDIHGRADLLAQLHARIRADAAAHPAARRILVYLGDYVDRGPDSQGVVETILAAPLDGFAVVGLRGNHEDLMLAFLDDVAGAANWFFNGGLATLASYGVPSRTAAGASRPAHAIQQEFRRALPARHLAFFRDLALSHREGDYVFVHAGIRPGVPLDDQDPLDLIWIRDAFLASREDHGFVVVHGHSIRPEPEDTGNRIGIDTGAYATGVLTCLVLQGGERHYLRTGAGA
ncbi:MAG: metallophosphoesterase family protein [Alphaproteobacteria bacterium]